MNAQTGTRLPIPSRAPPRNPPRPRLAAPSFSRLARGRSPLAGFSLLAVVWALALAFFVLAVAAPAAFLHRGSEPTRVARAARAGP